MNFFRTLWWWSWTFSYHMLTGMWGKWSSWTLVLMDSSGQLKSVDKTYLQPVAHLVQLPAFTGNEADTENESPPWEIYCVFTMSPLKRLGTDRGWNKLPSRWTPPRNQLVPLDLLKHLLHIPLSSSNHWSGVKNGLLRNFGVTWKISELMRQGFWFYVSWSRSVGECEASQE